MCRLRSAYVENSEYQLWWISVLTLAFERIRADDSPGATARFLEGWLASFPDRHQSVRVTVPSAQCAEAVERAVREVQQIQDQQFTAMTLAHVQIDHWLIEQLADLSGRSAEEIIQALAQDLVTSRGSDE